MASVVKPSTPVLLQFKDGKHAVLHADIVARIIPKFADLVKTLPVVVDAADGVGRATLDLKQHVTLEEAMKIATYVCGGKFEWSMQPLFKRMGIPVSPPNVRPVSLPNTSLLYKGNANEGALIALTLKGVQDNLFRGCCCAFTFGGAFGDKLPDGPYTVATTTIKSNAGNVFTVTRQGDLAHTFVLKVALKGPADLDSLFDSFVLTTGGIEQVALDLATNNALAKAYDLWPHKNNDARREADQEWVATIPIVLRQTTAYTKIVKPMVALAFHETYVELKNVKKGLCAEFALDVDYVYLDSPARCAVANGGGEKIASNTVEVKSEDAVWRSKPDESWDDPGKVVLQQQAAPEPKALRFNEFFLTQYQTVKEYFDSGTGKTRRIRILANHPTSGFIIIMTPDDLNFKDQQQQQIAPVVKACLELNGRVFQEYDLSDLTEWNWIKCGMKSPPQDFRTLLMPMSREMFWGDTRDDAIVCPCTVNLSRMDNVYIVLELNEEVVSASAWTANITAVSVNVSKTCQGMEGLKFAC